MKTFFPDNIRTVGVITPAGRLAPELMESGIAELRKAGIRVKGPESLPECRVSYLAGTPEDRAAQIMKMWLDPEVDLLLCSRGGFGCAQLLPHLNWKKLRARRIPLAGYSDITALHWAMASRNAGLPVVCPMLGKLSGLDEASCRDMKKVFSGEVRRCAVERISGGDFSGGEAHDFRIRDAAVRNVSGAHGAVCNQPAFRRDEAGGKLIGGDGF